MYNNTFLNYLLLIIATRYKYVKIVDVCCITKYIKAVKRHLTPIGSNVVVVNYRSLMIKILDHS